MSSMILNGDTSGAITVTVPAVAGTNTVTIPASTGTVMVSGNMPAFSAYLSANQTGISNSTFTKVLCNTEEFDTASAYDNATNYRFQPLVAGYYQINGCVNMAGTSGSMSTVLASIYKNGSEYKRGAEISTPLATFATVIDCPISSIVYLNGSTDYVELWAYLVATSGSFGGAGTAITWFNGCLLRAA